MVRRLLSSIPQALHKTFSCLESRRFVFPPPKNEGFLSPPPNTSAHEAAAITICSTLSAITPKRAFKSLAFVNEKRILLSFNLCGTSRCFALAFAFREITSPECNAINHGSKLRMLADVGRECASSKLVKHARERG
jgi:hypothetical protein